MKKETNHFDLIDFIALVRSLYGEGVIPLHRPVFIGREREYVVDTIDSNFVSSVGQRVTDFENSVLDFVGSKYAIATVNGTSALHTALLVSGVSQGDEVLSQALTFVATANAINYAGAKPIFIDVDNDTLGMSPEALRIWLANNAVSRSGVTLNKRTGAKISACVPMHTFGNPVRINEICAVCNNYGISVIEDAAEGLGSFIDNKHVGTYGKLGVISFNGNKIITTGGGGVILTDDELCAQRAKHITTTAKVSHPWNFFHDMIGYNYRMPNLNAALGCAQMEYLDKILYHKKEVALQYKNFCEERSIEFVSSTLNAVPNNWLNAVVLENKGQRDYFLSLTNEHGIMTRPIWTLMNTLPEFKKCQTDDLLNSKWLADRVINIPSSVP